MLSDAWSPGLAATAVSASDTSRAGSATTSGASADPGQIVVRLGITLLTEVLEHQRAGGAVAVAIIAAQADQSGQTPDEKACLWSELADVEVTGSFLPVSELRVGQSSPDGQGIDLWSILEQPIQVLDRRVPRAGRLAVLRLLVVPAEDLFRGGGERPGVVVQQSLVVFLQLRGRDGYRRTGCVDSRA